MDSPFRTYAEKRDYLRMTLDTPIDIYSQGEHIEGTCLNLSGTGLLIATHKAFELGNELEVSLSSNHGHNPKFHALTEVKWVNTADNGFLAGLAIKDLL